MPLIKKPGKSAHSKNVAQLIRDGYGQKQANAIAYSVGGESKKKKKKK